MIIIIGCYELFVFGLKSGLLVHKTQKGFFELESTYPFIEFSSGNRLYTQTKEQKIHFLEVGIILTKEGLEYKDDKIGVLLGIPKIATDDFVKGIEKTDRVCIEYHGLPFVVNQKNVIPALLELKENMPIPKKIIKKYDSKILFSKWEGFKWVEVDNVMTKGWLNEMRETHVD